MVRQLGESSVKRAESCVRCHYTPREDKGRVKAVSSISCESCHGPAADWLLVHNDYGGRDVTRQQETFEHRQLRISFAIAQGMRHPSQLYSLARSCYACHIVDDEALVNVAGHPSRSSTFELVAWSQGGVRHNLFRSDGQSNEVSSIERRRVMFVIGVLTDCEYSLRAVGKATERNRYALEHASSVHALRSRIAVIAERTKHPQLEAVSRLVAGIKMQLGNGAELQQAADAISKTAWQLAQSLDGMNLAMIDDLLPAEGRFVGVPLQVEPR